MTDTRSLLEREMQGVDARPFTLDTFHRRRERKIRNQRIAAFVVALAIMVVPAWVLATGGPSEPTAPATPPPATPSATVEVAYAFASSYGTFDADRAISYLSDDADVLGIADGLDGFRLHLAWLESVGYRQIVQSCEESSGSAGTSVSCAFDFHLLGSDAIGLGSYRGSSFDFSLHDGKIDRASVTWETAEFSPQLWEPFATWVSIHYPDDAAVMYTDSTHSVERLTTASIELWAERSHEYTEIKLDGAVRIADRFMAARKAHDIETAMALVIDDNIASRLLFNNGWSTSMPWMTLNREEVALALEAEQIYGVVYDSVECAPTPNAVGVGVGVSTPGAPITCSFVMDSVLREISHRPPRATSFQVFVRGGQISGVSFPTLNISWNPGGIYPAEFRGFVKWLGQRHPDAGVGWPAPEVRDPTVFRTGGQEWTLILTRESVDLLAAYLGGYLRSRGG